MLIIKSKPDRIAIVILWHSTNYTLEKNIVVDYKTIEPMYIE